MNQKIPKTEYEKYERFAKKHTKLEIMEKYNISSSLVDLLRWKYGFSFQPRKIPTVVRSKDMTKEEFVKFCKTHVLKDIKDYFNVSPSTVYSWERKYDFNIKKSVNPAEKTERNTLIVKMSKTKSVETISQEFGLTKQRVGQILNTYKKREKNGNN